MPAKKFIVSGRVQGVFFRDSTARQAKSLGLSGHAINLVNGDVEVLVQGDAVAIATLAEWLQSGPPLARVRNVAAEVLENVAVADGFRVG